jgi:hypothetical protein
MQAEGNYEAGGELLEKYGHVSETTKKIIESLSNVPRDLDNQ